MVVRVPESLQCIAILKSVLFYVHRAYRLILFRLVKIYFMNIKTTVLKKEQG